MALRLGRAADRLFRAERGMSRQLGYTLGVCPPGYVFWDTTSYTDFVALTGDAPKHILAYQHWGAGDGYQFYASMWDTFLTLGVIPILTWEAWDWAGTMPQAGYALSTIISGSHDTAIDAWATAAAAYAKPLYIRPMHEMNGDFYPWGQGVNSNTPAQYVAAFRHIVNRFRAVGATNVCWIWSPNVLGLSAQYPLTGLYPGDTYVDMVGIDGYNWGTAGVGDVGWVSFTTVFGATYDLLRSIAPSKPIYIAETACGTVGGDKAAWITSALLNEIPNRFPALAGLVWFDVNKEDNWLVDSSPASLAAYRSVAARDPHTYLPHNTQALSAPAAYATTLLAMSPDGYWRVGESSGTVADNAEGTAARDGTYVGTPTLGATGLLNGDANTAVTFNGTSQWITVADAAIWDCFEGTNPWSVAMWSDHTAAADGAFLLFKRSTDWASSIAVKSFATGLEVQRVTATHTDDVTVPSIHTGKRFLVVTYSGTALAVYVDGALATVIGGSAAATQSMPALAQLLHFAGTDWGGGYAAGTFDEIAVWARAITAAEVSSLMDAGTV
jgi:Glycosyl hydrolase family 26/Concanavalin A-like lectin/glucanases superfamily